MHRYVLTTQVCKDPSKKTGSNPKTLSSRLFAGNHKLQEQQQTALLPCHPMTPPNPLPNKCVKRLVLVRRVSNVVLGVLQRSRHIALCCTKNTQQPNVPNTKKTNPQANCYNPTWAAKVPK